MILLFDAKLSIDAIIVILGANMSYFGRKNVFKTHISYT